MTSEPAAAPAGHRGPLIPVYEQARENGSLAIGGYEAFVGETGVPLVGEGGWTVALVELESSDPLRVISKFAAFNPVSASFESSEHAAIGDDVILRFDRDDPGPSADLIKLEIQPGLRLTYGQIVALGGDFYGVPDKPIADGATPAQRRQRFIDCYNTLANGNGKETTAILSTMQREISAVNSALSQGLPASAAYERLGNDLNKAWNKITGGGSSVSDLIPWGRYLDLAEKNWDHFGEWAVRAYQAGHAVALSQAIDAHNTADPAQARKLLTTAYAMNAFADHFLSDMFSAGHMREPRRQIYQTARIGVTANLCAKAMHDEDSRYGLRVSNANGDTWRAYGDKRHFDTVNLQNKALVEKAMQASATEIFEAFISGNQPANSDAYLALRFAPDLDQVRDHANNPLRNFVPMFVIHQGAVECRNDLNDLNTAGWTTSWMTGTVAAWLHSPAYQPNEPSDYIAPPTAAPQISPTGWQSNQPSPPNWINGNQVCYAVSFVGPTFESMPGPSCAYYRLSDSFQPTLTGLPIGPAGIVARNIYREFLNHRIEYCGSVRDNTTTSFVDTMP